MTNRLRLNSGCDRGHSEKAWDERVQRALVQRKRMPMLHI